MDDGRSRYLELRAARPELFENREAGVYPIADTEAGQVFIENRFLLGITDIVQFADGHVGPYLRLLASPSGSVGVAILPYCKGRVLLLDVPRHATGRRHLEIPRGFGEPGETPEASARRELLEETGLKADRMLPLGRIFADTGLVSNSTELFLAELRNETGVSAECGLGHKWYRAPEFFQAISEGVIEDGFSVSAAMRARLRGLI